MKLLTNAKNNNEKTPILWTEEGRIGYFVLWLLGVPASLLFFVFLIRGH